MWIAWRLPKDAPNRILGILVWPSGIPISVGVEKPDPANAGNDIIPDAKVRAPRNDLRSQ